jgi:hypothetical protein
MKDEDVYPKNTVVRLKKTGQFAVIREVQYLRPELQKYFLHYLAEIEDRDGLYCVFHHDVELECL